MCRAPPFWCSRALHRDCIAYSLLVGLLIYRHFSWSRLIPMLVETAALSGATAWCETGDYGAVHHALAAAERGDVIIVEAGGRLDAAMIGEILCGFARRKGIAGVAVNGAVRDTGTLTQWRDFAVFTLGTTPRGPSSMERGVVNDPVVFAGVQVAPNDLVLGDDDGLVVIPRAEAEQRIQSAVSMVKAEEEWKRAISRGETTLELFKVPAAI